VWPGTRRNDDRGYDAGDTGDGEERLLIDGRLRTARAGKVFETVNPATGEVLGVAADGTAEDMDDAIGAARRAFDETDWSTDVELRVRGLRQLQQAFERHADEIRAMTVAETGSPLSLTYSAQLDTPVGRSAGGRSGRVLRVGDRPGQRRAAGHPVPPLGAP